MTKVQLKNEAMALATEYKANKALMSALTELFEQYAANSKNVEKREKVIERDGISYTWCNKHEIYEPTSNFKKDASDCLLAVKAWQNHSKEIRELEKELTSKAILGEDVQEIAKQLQEAKDVRSGKYSFEENALQYPDIEGYEYNDDNFIQE